MKKDDALPMRGEYFGAVRVDGTGETHPKGSYVRMTFHHKGVVLTITTSLGGAGALMEDLAGIVPYDG